tara:strand:+ start:375 stop:653 length:279 start_codon:yes stop_codon:yes gene_type:complete
MKQLISATLSEEAATIYNSWEKQKKSARLSEMIIKEDSNMNHIEALQKARASLQSLLSSAMLYIWQKDKKHPLVKKINNSLLGTIHYQYWDN